jgi:cysteinyl-tRNA synthetase
MFPHHENEIAIAEALTGKPLANFWLHSGLLLKDGKKMSREAGNIITLQEVLEKGYTGREIRFFLLGVHYRKALKFNWQRLDAVRMGLRRFDEFTRKLLCLTPGKVHPEVEKYVTNLERRFSASMDDDLNVSGAIGALFDFVKEVNLLLDLANLDLDQKNIILASLERVNSVFGILQLTRCQLAPEVELLIQKRENARENKDWQAADQAREELLRLGVIINDTATGPAWELSDKACGKCEKSRRQND